MFLRSIFLISLLFLKQESWALVPLKNILLGDLSHQIKSEESDPLNYIFKTDQDLSDQLTQQFDLWRGYFQAGEDLERSCSNSERAIYQSEWSRQQMLRSIVATAQYLGLNLTTRALSQYARELGWEVSEFKQFSEKIVDHYCSPNLSTISLKEVKNNFLFFFGQNLENLPSFETENLFFPEGLKDGQELKRIREREFVYTTKVFRNFCSWGGQGDDWRLMTSFLKNPSFMALVKQNLEGRRFVSHKRKLKKESFKSSRVMCENLICRKRDESSFLQQFPKLQKSLGSSNDFDRVYCQEFRDLFLKRSHPLTSIAKWMKETTKLEEKKLTAQLGSLITGIPDLLIWSDSFDDLKKNLESSFQKKWNQWARISLEKSSERLFFEDYLAVQSLPKLIVKDDYSPVFKLAFDINLGEFDRMMNEVGKLAVDLEIQLPKDYLKWFKQQWSEAVNQDQTRRDYLTQVMQNQISGGLSPLKVLPYLDKFRGKFLKLAAADLITVLDDYNGPFFDKDNPKKTLKIPLSFNLGPFALQYLSVQNTIKNSL